MNVSAEGSTARTADPRVAMSTLAAGASFAVAAVASSFLEPAWFLMIIGFALLIYAIPGLHRHQAPADGPVGFWGSRLVVFGGGVVIALALVFLVWEAVGTPSEDEGIVGPLWMIGFFSFVIGTILFAVASLRAGVLPRIGPILMLGGLVGALAIDMATGAFFEDDTGGTTEWGFYLGVPLFGLGLAWIGYSLWNHRVTAGENSPSTT